MLEFTQSYDLALGKSFFEKREEHYVTYMSGTNRRVIDYIEKKDELSLRLAEHMGRRKHEEETTWEDICHMINNNAKDY